MWTHLLTGVEEGASPLFESSPQVGADPPATLDGGEPEKPV